MGTGTASKKTRGDVSSGTKPRQRKPDAASGVREDEGPARGGRLITGEPIELRLENVEEDSDQPRQTFGEEAMQELTDSIATHGVKVPIAVHRHPDIQGRYIINDGARRYRAALRAGLASLPAVVTDAFSLVELIVVNKVRDDTPAKDKARAFARLLKANGWTQTELAQKLKLSEAYISQHMVLLNLPDPVNALFESGRCTDVTLISEIMKAYKKGPGEVEAWLADEDQEITRGSVKVLRSFLGNKRAIQHERREQGSGHDGLDGMSGPDGHDAGDANDMDRTATTLDPEAQDSTSDGQTGKTRSSDKIAKTLILATYERRSVRVITNRRWSSEGLGWVRFEDTGEEAEIELARLKLRRFVEA